MELGKKISTVLSNVKTYWKKPMKGRYMSFREIAAYSGGGIGAYMIITLGTACILGTGNTLISSTLGVGATDMYILYVIAVLTNIPLTGLRANIIDNTRNKAGKYRPYIVSMAIPTAIIAVLMVWFPYDKVFGSIFGSMEIFGKSASYVAKCALILFFNLLLNFFYYFFYDSYENLIHVLSPNSQERADVTSIKAIVYSFAPSVINLITPIIASKIYKTNTTDIRVYRLLYPILAVLGILLCIIVYKYTEEKIVQARTHVIQIRFTDSLREVAKNKYFWIIALAGWIGFLETSYANIQNWLYNYGGVCSGTVYGIVVTLYGNSSLWGMLMAPFAIRKWGKKKVLVFTNVLNIVFILMMLPATAQMNGTTMWLVLICLYLNGVVGSFMHILNPAIQADIRDYQQYKTGERIDGMFSAVTTIGSVISLVTSSVLPFIYEKGGITEANAKIVTSNPDVLNRMLGDGKTVGTILKEQLAQGQNNYINAYSALYDVNILSHLLHVLIIVSAVGALLNVIPYIWYDFDEKKQKSVVNILKVRALFEDYDNGVLTDRDLVETVDIINNAKEMSGKTPKSTNKKDYNNSGKSTRKEAKKAYKEALKYNEDIEVSKMVCDELYKFSKDLYIQQVKAYTDVYNKGLAGLKSMSLEAIKDELKKAKSLPTTTPEQKELRKFSVEIASKKKLSYKTIHKYYGGDKAFEKPDFAHLELLYNKEDEIDKKLKDLYNDLHKSKKEHDSTKEQKIRAEIKKIEQEKKPLRKEIKAEMDKHAYFNRAAKPYLDAEKLLKQQENYKHLDEIESLYIAAKERLESVPSEV